MGKSCKGIHEPVIKYKKHGYVPAYDKAEPITVRAGGGKLYKYIYKDRLQSKRGCLKAIIEIADRMLYKQDIG